MNRFRFLVLVCFFPFVALLNGQSLTDRLETVLASPPDTHQVRQLKMLSDSFINSRKIVPAILFERGLELAHELNYSWGLTRLYTNQYVYCLNTGEVEKGLVIVNKTIEYLEDSGDIRFLNFAFLSKVDFLMMGGYTKEAAELASSLAKKFHDSGNLKGEVEVYGLLSMLSSGLGNSKLTMYYDSIGLALASRSGNDLLICQTLLTVSGNHSLLGSSDQALALAEEALVIARKGEYSLAIRNALSMRAEANTALGNYSKALKDYETLKVGELGQKSSWRMINKGFVLQRLQRQEEARMLLLESVELIKKTSNDPLELKRAFQALQTVGLSQAQFDTVSYYRQLMNGQEDSLQAAENIKNLLELEEQYKAEEKEVEIRFQQEQLTRQKTQLYATIIGLLLALIGGTGFFLLSRNLRKRNLENERLLTDKETLMGEIHHRVKNNLQVVSSLLQLQRRDLETEDEKGQEALLESQNRVSAMGLIHKKLYQGKEVASVNMREYLEDLGETLLDAYRLEEQIEIFYDVADINLDVDVAIPLGLIINELVANSIKYAFPKGREGTIEIALHREEGKLRLGVLDNGVGISGREGSSNSPSFGNNLIDLLTKKLKGRLQIVEDRGYGVEILFTG